MDSERAVSLLIHEGLAEIDHRYGESGETPLLYHSPLHTIEVMDAATAIADLAAKRGKISPDDVPLIKLAACYHDVEHSLPCGEAEASSAQIVMERMQRLGEFGKEAITKVGAMVIATTVSFVGDRIVQSAGSDYPSQILADADLSALGKPFDIFWDKTTQLFNEMSYPEPFRPDKKFFIGEIALLRAHKFYTPEATELFPHQNENLQKLEELAEAA